MSGILLLKGFVGFLLGAVVCAVAAGLIGFAYFALRPIPPQQRNNIRQMGDMGPLFSSLLTMGVVIGLGAVLGGIGGCLLAVRGR